MTSCVCETQYDMDKITFALDVNGTEYTVRVEPRKLLSDVLREDCGLTGTHVGCEHGVCGACTVQVDGSPLRACLTFAVQMQGHRITTIESQAVDGVLSPLQQALGDAHGLQCGFCTPGIVMTFDAWLRDHSSPTEEEVRDVLSGNLCRCTGYQSIVAAVMSVASTAGASARTTPAATPNASTGLSAQAPNASSRLSAPASPRPGDQAGAR